MGLRQMDYILVLGLVDRWSCIWRLSVLLSTRAHFTVLPCESGRAVLLALEVVANAKSSNDNSTQSCQAVATRGNAIFMVEDCV